MKFINKTIFQCDLRTLFVQMFIEKIAFKQGLDNQYNKSFGILQGSKPKITIRETKSKNFEKLMHKLELL